MIKYFKMAIDKGNSDAICDLKEYYINQKKYDELIEYFKMIVEKGNTTVMYSLLDCCKIAKCDYYDAFISLIMAYKNNYVTKEYVERFFGKKYMLDIVKCFAECDVNISNFKLDKTYIKIYELTSKNKMLENENSELKLKAQIV